MDNIIDFKIITLGNHFVGKTSIFKKYIYKVFGETKSTIGMNMYVKEKIILKNKKEVKLILVDTAGTENYKSVSKQYIKNADGVLFVFSFDNVDSLQAIDQWIKIFTDYKSNERKIPMYLIGNKNDLVHNVTDAQINKFLKNNEDFKFKSISAKEDDDKINELFEEMAEQLYEEYKKDENKSTTSVKLATMPKDKTVCFLVKCIA